MKGDGESHGVPNSLEGHDLAAQLPISLQAEPLPTPRHPNDGVGVAHSGPHRDEGNLSLRGPRHPQDRGPRQPLAPPELAMLPPQQCTLPLRHLKDVGRGPALAAQRESSEVPHHGEGALGQPALNRCADGVRSQDLPPSPTLREQVRQAPALSRYHWSHENTVLLHVKLPWLGEVDAHPDSGPRKDHDARRVLLPPKRANLPHALGPADLQQRPLGVHGEPNRLGDVPESDPEGISFSV